MTLNLTPQYHEADAKYRAAGTPEEKLTMSNKESVSVIARLRAKPGKEGVVREELMGLVEPSRKETGCINYDLHLSDDTTGLFLFHETWASR